MTSPAFPSMNSPPFPAARPSIGSSPLDKLPAVRFPTSSRLPGSLDRYHGIADMGCRVLLKEAKTFTPVLENDEICEVGFPTWSTLGRLLSPLVPRTVAADSPREQFGYLALACTSEDMMGCGSSPCLYGFNVAVQSMPPPTQEQEDSDKHNYYVNIGYAIRTLREELPTMFYKELTYDIYREDILFQNPMNAFCGLDNYKLFVRALCFYGRIFFKALWVDILRIWQPHDNVIMVRWQVHGIPRVPWEAQGIFDGISEYKLDKKGKICEHKVDNAALSSSSRYKVPTVAELLRIAVSPTSPKPTCFEKTEN